MKPIALFTLTLIISLLSCQTPELDPVKFVKPKVTNSQYDSTDIAIPFEAESITQVYPVFAGKYKFGEMIDVNRAMRDTSYQDDYNQGRFDMEYTPGFASVSTNGFELICDYETTVKYEEYYDDSSRVYQHYPVYFVNSTKSDKMFIGKDGHVFGIQEATIPKTSYEWRPIEGAGFDFCGNGYWGLIIHPNEFAVALMRKYEGDTKTKMRVRFRLDENTIVSKPFIGAVNEKQFKLRDSSFLQERLIETNGMAASWLFYGAFPQEKEWAVKTF